MMELSKFLTGVENTTIKEKRISLSGKLEAIIGNYFVSGEGIPDVWNLLTVYYDSEIDTYTESVELIPENIVAYVEPDYKWAFVRNSHIEKFKEDTLEYGINYIAVSSFEDEILQCSNPDLLPEEFSGIVWIDDDFMNDENIPFDYDAFAEIDDGVKYLNPKHFSVVELYQILSIAGQKI